MADRTAVETLIAAADVLRKRAKNTTPWPWYANWDNGVYAWGKPDDPQFPNVISGGRMSYDDTEWIATVHPGVAEPLAAWLEREAERLSSDLPSLEARSTGFAKVAWEHQCGHALAVARVILGEVPDA